MAVTMKNGVFRDVVPCGFIMTPSPCKVMIIVYSAFKSVSYRLILFLVRVISCTLKMETTRSSETSVYNKPTWRHIPEDDILNIRS
jgi:hypothetical protein